MQKEEGSCSFVFRFIGNYQKFYSAIKAAYPEVNIISSCDRSTISPSNPADLYDVHVMSLCYFLGCLSKFFTMVDKKTSSLGLQVYTSSSNMFSRTSMFDNTPRSAPKVYSDALRILQCFISKLNT